jgi:hypothetical protein
MRYLRPGDDPRGRDLRRFPELFNPTGRALVLAMDVKSTHPRRFACALAATASMFMRTRGEPKKLGPPAAQR